MKLKCYKREEEKFFKFVHNLSEMEARGVRARGLKGKKIKIYVETFERASERERGGKQVVIATKQ